MKAAVTKDWDSLQKKKKKVLFICVERDEEGDEDEAVEEVGDHVRGLV